MKTTQKFKDLSKYFLETYGIEEFGGLKNWDRYCSGRYLSNDNYKKYIKMKKIFISCSGRSFACKMPSKYRHFK